MMQKTDYGESCIVTLQRIIRHGEKMNRHGAAVAAIRRRRRHTPSLPPPTSPRDPRFETNTILIAECSPAQRKTKFVSTKFG